VLLPPFLSDFAEKYPQLHIEVREMTTDAIQRNLHTRNLDLGIVALPLEDEKLREIPLYNEPFMLYDCFSKEQNNTVASIKGLDYAHLCLLEEGHCLRVQVEKICELSAKKPKVALNFDFKAGSIDSLIRFTKMNKGMLPYLATLDFSDSDVGKLSHFTSPVPVRTIGLVVHKHFVKKRLLTELQLMIKERINPMLSNAGKE